MNQPEQSLSISALDQEKLVYIFEKLGMDEKALNDLRLVSKDFNKAVSELIYGYLVRMENTIKEKSGNIGKLFQNMKTKIESEKQKISQNQGLISSINTNAVKRDIDIYMPNKYVNALDGEIQVSNDNVLNINRDDSYGIPLLETDIADTINFIYFLRQIGGGEEAKKLRIEKFEEILKLYRKHVQDLIANVLIVEDSEEFSKKNVLILILQSIDDAGILPLLWEKDENSALNKALRQVIEYDIDRASKGMKKLSIKDLRNAQLQNMEFGDASQNELVNLFDVRFEGANLNNVDFSGAYNIDANELCKASSLMNLKGIRYSNDYSNRPAVGGNIKFGPSELTKNWDCRQFKLLVQEKMAEEYIDLLFTTTDFMKVILMLDELSTMREDENFLKVIVDDGNPNPLESVPRYYKKVMEAGRERIIKMVNADLAVIPEDKRNEAKTALTNVFKERLGFSPALYGKSINQIQLEEILGKLNLHGNVQHQINGPQLQ